ncbi:MAG TPA: DUF262 domain-containing HNH endonuclease family protein [Ideonella sp.]|uniref:DUF262 domain-containing protein n=1 Tax=Ideonella sp. TaxID=1929293 RepID=UPI002BD22C6E|nr:DUF262 domain-containing HNH endonuclease family protein [Ideonella sp.]HSI47528.1 DUF262 domain-containing HNH endonuclease family protein [Ideonella sp.]
MEVKAQVHNISKLKDYYFLVPDYQREYVWKVDDQVEQFLGDIANEFEPGAKSQSSYFLGSIIIVRNDDGKYDVIDGQQRLTTTVLTVCAFRDLLKGQAKGQALDAMQTHYFQTIESWLSGFDMETNEVQVRLELQYEESRDFLSKLIQGQLDTTDETASIQKMRQAYERIRSHLEQYLATGLQALTEYAQYFLTKIDLVIIESENLSSALKIFETINQRGAGLNAMDLVKNLLFREAKESEFAQIKQRWQEITAHLKLAGEGDSPLRFLRYFLMARYHQGILREDDIYKWIISAEGKRALGYELQPLKFAAELERGCRRYAALVQATELLNDGGEYPAVTRIGFINKVKSRQHLILLLALDHACPASTINYLAAQIESVFFYSITLGIQAKNNERLFSQWAANLRGLKDEAAIATVVDATLRPYLQGKLEEFRQRFLALRDSDYDPLYRLRYVLGRMENTLLAQCNTPQKGLRFIDGLQIEHILPQTPRNGLIPLHWGLARGEYDNHVYRLGNVTLLESTINQAVAKHNDLNGPWFAEKQKEYVKSGLLSTQLLDHNFSIGVRTAVNRLKPSYGFNFVTWDAQAIQQRQGLLLELAMDTWTLGGRRLDA